MANLYQAFLALLPNHPLLIGTVTELAPDGCLARLPTGDVVKVRGSAAIGQSVFFRDGVIEGNAPNLQVVEIEV